MTVDIRSWRAPSAWLVAVCVTAIGCGGAGAASNGAELTPYRAAIRQRAGHAEYAALEKIRVDTRSGSGRKAEAYYLLGSTLYLYHKIDSQAQAPLVRAVQLEPNSVAARTALGKLYLHERYYDLALGQYEAAMRLDPADFDATWGTLRSLRGLFRCDEALLIATGAVRRWPNAPELWVELGECSANADDPQHADLLAAQRYFERGLALAPDDAALNDGMGRALSRAGMCERAAQHFRTAIKADATYWYAYRDLGDCLLRLGRRSEALDAYVRYEARLRPVTSMHAVLFWDEHIRPLITPGVKIPAWEAPSPTATPRPPAGRRGRSSR